MDVKIISTYNIKDVCDMLLYSDLGFKLYAVCDRFGLCMPVSLSALKRWFCDCGIRFRESEEVLAERAMAKIQQQVKECVDHVQQLTRELQEFNHGIQMYQATVLNPTSEMELLHLCQQRRSCLQRITSTHRIIIALRSQESRLKDTGLNRRATMTLVSCENVAETLNRGMYTYNEQEAIPNADLTEGQSVTYDFPEVKVTRDEPQVASEPLI
jgi:hypothetical protein